ncbi:ABC transporter B family member, partial [Trifolium medium]|nr:ABC transporter B family member [Trifolium medium]
MHLEIPRTQTLLIKSLRNLLTTTYFDRVSLKFVYLGAGALVASFLQLACWMITGERQAARIRGLYLKTILRQDVIFSDKETNTGEVVGRMSGDTVLIKDAMGEK